MFVGEVLDSYIKEDKQPLAYHGGKYLDMGEELVKPSEKQREEMKKVSEEFTK